MPAGFEAIEDWSDPASVRSQLPDGHMVYAGKATFTRKVRIGKGVAPGQYAMSCLFSYQACNARQCLRPVESRLRVSLNIQESQTKTHPLKLRVKSDELENPLSNAMEVNDSRFPELIKYSAFSSRKRLTNSLGVSPTIA